ncbi:MAG: phosphoadenosine phosphosulfate reductase family protein [Flavobacteriaceae bacterium]|nr:phosphoadenosine phosphosulfate reductase family protein [Flavobacteriaceae bacterium]
MVKENFSIQDIETLNKEYRNKSPLEVISFVMSISERPLISTSFGAYSAALLAECVKVKKDIQVIWCDTGYNTDATYTHANFLIDTLKLSIDIFTPKLTTAFIKNRIGEPNLDNPNHELFSDIVKIEPFSRAFNKYNPDVWLTNIRKNQTSLRETLDIFSLSCNGNLKIAPFYYFSDQEMLQFLKENNLPVEFDYYDPVKALENRECGIHFSN